MRVQRNTTRCRLEKFKLLVARFLNSHAFRWIPSRTKVRVDTTNSWYKPKPHCVATRFSNHTKQFIPRGLSKQSIMQSSGHHYATSSGGNLNHNRHVQTQMSAADTQERLEQLFDEQDHKRCSEGNRKALLASNLDQLRGLAKVLEADDWKYQSNKSSGGFAWSSTSRMQSLSGSNS